MVPERLLAKSVPGGTADTGTSPPVSIFLPNHLADVYFSAEAIADAVGHQMLQSFGLNEKEWLRRFEKILFLSAALHDIGKANNHFQRAVHGIAASDERQPIRHEWISVWIANQPAMKQWLLPAVENCEHSWNLAMYAVAGHHPAIHHGLPDDKNFQSKPVQILTSHPDFQTCLAQLREWFQLSASNPKIESVVYSGKKTQSCYRGPYPLSPG